MTMPAIFKERYIAFLNRLVLSSSGIDTIGQRDKAAFCCYLINQSRFNRAYEVFRSIDSHEARSEFEETYSYIYAFLSLAQNEVDRALKIAHQYCNNDDVPPQQKEKWETIAKQCYESKNVSSADLTFIPERILDDPPTYNIKCLKHKFKIYHNAAARVPVKLEFWVLDLEMQFSAQPFDVAMDSWRFMQPNYTIERIKLADGSCTMVGIPGELRNRNSIIRLSWGTEGKEVVVYDYDNDIDVQVSCEVGEVRVVSTEQKSVNEPICGAYCKVYSKNYDGTIQFYKDGYTDIRGRFNYRDISSSDQEKAVRFSLLVTTNLGSSKCEIEAKVKI